MNPENYVKECAHILLNLVWDHQNRVL